MINVLCPRVTSTQTLVQKKSKIRRVKEIKNDTSVGHIADLFKVSERTKWYLARNLCRIVRVHVPFYL